MAKPAVRLVGIRGRSRAGLLRSTALQAAVLVAIEFPGGARPARAQPSPNAQPMGGSVVAGQASISRNPTTTTINQASQRAAINWQSFNVGSQQTVQFQQPSSSAWTLNRVNSANPSQIAGRIDANGNIVLTNPSGVVFYRGSQVNAQSVVISAPGITNQNFMAGRMVFDQAPNPNARIVNAGTITVKQAGLAALVAPQVRNSGVITAKLGKVVLGGASAATLDMYGDGLLSFDVTGEVRQVPLGRNGKPVTALVTNTGTILASGGTVQLTARAADGIVQNLVDAGGMIAAPTAGTRTGRIEIDGTGGSITIAGNVAATGAAASQTGGQIELNATGSVVLTGRARVDASGGAGGGTIAIGTTLARARGGPSVASRRTASRVIVRHGATVTADATATGQGGQITLLSTANTVAAGSFAARGGPQGGNGGNVEISGEQGFSLTGSIDVSNRGAGSAGSILLDPSNLTVVSGSAGTGSADGTITNGGTIVYNNGTVTATVSNGELAALTGNIVLQATNSLDVAASFSGLGSVDLRAGGMLTVEPGVTIAGVNVRLDGGEIFPITAPSALPTGNGGVTVNGVVLATDGTIEVAGGSLGVAINGSLFAFGGSLAPTPDIILAATGPAGIQLGAGSFISTSGILDLSTIGAGNVVQSPTSQISADTLQSSNGVAGSATLTSTLNDIGTLGNFAAGPTLSVDSFLTVDDLTVSGTVSAGSALNLVSGGPLTLSGTLIAPTISLAAQEQFGISGDINQTSGSVLASQNLVLTADGSIDQTGGVMVAGTLSGSSGNNIVPSNFAPGGSGTTTLPSAGNAIANLGNFSSVGGFTLTDGAALTASGSIADTASVGLNVTGALALSGTLNAPLVSLVASGGISQPSGQILATEQLSGSSGSTTSLISPTNTIASVGSFTSTDDFALAAGSLALFEPITVGTGHTLALTADSITFVRAAALSAPSGTVALAPLTAGLPVDFGSAGNAGSLDVLPANLAKITASTLQIGSPTAGPVNIGDIVDSVPDTIALAPIATLNVLSEGAVTQNGILSVATLTGAAAAVTLTNANSIGVLGSFTASGGMALTDATPLTVAGPVFDPPNITLTATALTIGGLVSASGTVDLIATTGAISEPGGTILTGALTGSGTSVSLTGSANSIATLDAFAATSGDFALTNTGNLSIAGEVSGTDVNLIEGGTIGEATTGLIAAGTLSGSASAMALGETNFVSSLGSLTTQSGLVLNDGVPLAVAGPVTDNVAISLTSNGPLTVGGSITAPAVDLTATQTLIVPGSFAEGPGNIIETGGAVAGSTSVVLTAAGSIDQTGGALNAGALSGSSGATTSLAGAGNLVTTLGSFSSIGGFTLADGQALAIAGPVSDSASIAIASTGAMTAAGNLTAPAIGLGSGASITQTAGSIAATTGLTLIANGAVDQTGGSIAAGELSGSSGATANLPSTGNAVPTLGSFASGGGFTLTDNVAVSLLGTVSVAPAATLVITDDNITGAGGGLSAPSGTIVLEPLSTDKLFALAGPTSGTLPFTANTLVLGSPTAGSVAISNTVNLAGVPLLDVLSSTSFSEAAGTVLTVGTLEGAVGTGASLTATNSITTLAGFSAPGGFALADAEGLTVAGPVTAAAGIALSASGPLAIAGLLDGTPVSLTATGAISEPGGTITTGTLSGSGASVALTSAANAIGTLGGFGASTGSFALTDTGNLAIAGAVFGATVDLAATGSITEAAGGTVLTPVLTGSAAAASFAQAGNFVGTLGGFTTGSGFALTDGEALAVAGPVSDGASIALSSLGPLTLTGSLAAPSIALTANSGSIDGVAVAGDILQTAGAIAGSTAVVLTAGGSIDQTGGALAAGTLSGASGGATSLAGASNAVTTLGSFASTGGFALADAQALGIAGPVADSASIAITTAGAITASGNVTAPAIALAATAITQTAGSIAAATGLTLAAAGSIDQTGGSIVTASLGGSSGAATSLPSAGNAVTALGAFTAGGNFSLTDSVAVSLAGAVTVAPASTLTITDDNITGAGGALTAPSGTIVLAPLSSGKQFALGGPSSGALPFTADELVLGSPTAGPVVISNDINLAGVAVLDVLSGAGFSEAAGTALTVGTLEGAVSGTASFTATNSVATLAGFSATAGFTLADAEPLAVAGPVSDGASIALSSLGPLTLTGSLAAPSIALTANSGSIDGVAVAGDILQTAGAIAGSTAVVLTAGGSIDQTGGALAAGTLSGASGGATSLAGASNAVTTLGSFASTGGFALADAQALGIAGPVADSASIAITTAGAITASGNVTAPAIALAATAITQTAGSIAAATGLTLAAAGSIDQTGGSIVTASLGGSSGAATSLPSAGNAVTALGAFTAGGNFSLTDSTPLTLAGAISTAPSAALAITDDSFAIGAAGQLTAPSGTIVLAPLSTAAPFALAGTAAALPFTANTLVLGSPSAGPITISNDVNLAGVAVLDVLSGAAITEAAGTVLSVGTLEGAAGTTASFGATNSITALAGFSATGGFTLADAQGLTVSGPVTDPPGITLTVNGPLAIASLLSAPIVSLTASGAITEPGGTITTGTLSGSGASVALTSAANAIGTLGGFGASTGSFALTDTGNLAIAGAVFGATVDLAATGSITEAAGGTVLTPVLTGSAAAASFAQAGNFVGTLGGFTTGSGFALTDGEALAVAGPVSDGASIALSSLGPLTLTGSLAAPSIALTANSGSIDGVAVAGDILQTAGAIAGSTAVVLTAGGSIDQTGGALAAGTLSGASGGATSLAGASNAVTTLGSFASTGGFALADAQALGIAGPVADSASIAITTAGAITASGNVTAPAIALAATAITQTAGSIAAATGLTLAAAGSIDQTGGSIVTASLGGSSGAATSLPSAGNAVTALGAFTAGGNFSLTDSVAVSLAGAVTVAPASTLTITDDNITGAGGALTAPSGTIVLAPLSSGKQFALGGPSSGALPFTADELVLGSPTAGPVVISNDINLAGVAVLDVLSGAGFSEAAGTALTVGTLEGAVSGTASFTATNSVATLAGFSATAGFTLADAEPLAVAGPVSGGTSIALSSLGPLTLAGSLAAPSIALTANSGSIDGVAVAGDILQTAGAIAGSTAVVLTAGGSIDQTGGVIDAASLTGTSGLSTTLPGPGPGGNAIATLGGFGSSGGFALTDTRPLTVGGPVTDTASITLNVAGNLTLLSPLTAPLTLLNATGAIAESGGVINTGSLSVTAGSATLSNANAVATLADVSVTGAFALSDTTNLTVVNAASGGAMTLAATGSLNLTGDVSAPSLALPVTGNITQLSGIVVAGVLTGTAAAVSLPQGNMIGTLGSFTTTNGFTLSNLQALSVAGPVTDQTAVALTVGGDLTFAGSVAAPAITVAVQGGVTETTGNLATGTLAGSAGSVSLESAANTIATLGAFTAGGNFALADATALTVAGPISSPAGVAIAAAGDLTLAGTVNGASVALQTPGAITETGAGQVAAATLTGAAQSVAMNGANAVASLGNFAAAGGLSFTDTGSLGIGGAVSAGALTLNVGGNLAVSGGSLAASGAMTLNAGGGITEAGGSVAAGSLSGAANGLVQLGGTPGAIAAVGTLGSFSVSGGTLTLTDSVPLQINGPVSANDLAITATASLILNGGTIATLGLPLAQQLGAQPAAPGSFLQVLAGADGSARFVQLGVTTIDPPNGVVPTLRIQVPGNGSIALADLTGPTANLVLADPSGAIAGSIDVASLSVLATAGDARLVGAVAGIATGRAAAISTIAPTINPNYLLNGCVIMSPTCGGVVPPALLAQNPELLLPSEGQLLTLDPSLLAALVSESLDPSVLAALLAQSLEQPLVAGVTNECRTVGSLDTLTPDCLDLVLPNISNRDY